MSIVKNDLICLYICIYTAIAKSETPTQILNSDDAHYLQAAFSIYSSELEKRVENQDDRKLGRYLAPATMTILSD